MLECPGHVVRMDDAEAVKKLLEGKCRGGRKKGRSGLKWFDDDVLDLNMDVKIWRTRAVGRTKWASVMSKASVKVKGCRAKEKEEDKMQIHLNGTVLCHCCCCFVVVVVVVVM